MRRLHDGDLVKLADHDNAVYAEFINTPGRGPAWRLTNKVGMGVLLTHEQIESFKDYLLESLDSFYIDNNTSKE